MRQLVGPTQELRGRLLDVERVRDGVAFVLELLLQLLSGRGQDLVLDELLLDLDFLALHNRLSVDGV